MDCRINNESTRTNVRAGRRGPGIALPGTVAPSAANRRPRMGPACIVCTTRLLGKILPRRTRLSAAALRRTRTTTRPRHPATGRSSSAAAFRRQRFRLRRSRAGDERARRDARLAGCARSSRDRCDCADRQRGCRTRRRSIGYDRRRARAGSDAATHSARRFSPADPSRGFSSLLSNPCTGH